MSGSRIQPPSSQPGSYRLRSRQPNPEPTQQQQQQPISVKKPVSQAPLPATPAVSSVSHPPPPSSAHQNNIEEKEREKQIVSSTDSSVKDKPSAGEPDTVCKQYYMWVHCTYSIVWVIPFRQFNVNPYICMQFAMQISLFMHTCNTRALHTSYVRTCILHSGGCVCCLDCLIGFLNYRLNYRHVSCNTGRKSNCVREVEKLKKNREERRARQADKIAQRREVCCTGVCVCIVCSH